jgi:antitoxin ParD1/3/4
MIDEERFPVIRGVRMQVSLPPTIQKQIDERVKSGRYGSAGDVISEAVATLVQQEAFADFAPGELDALIEEADKDIANGDVVDGETFFAGMRRMSAELRGRKP